MSDEVTEDDITNPMVLMAAINKCMDLIGKSLFCIEQENDEDTILEFATSARYELIDIINNLKIVEMPSSAMLSKAEIEEQMFQVQYELDEQEGRLDNVRKEWMQQQDVLADLQQQLYDNQRMLSIQSIKACSQGAALAGAFHPILTQPGVLEFVLQDENLVSYVKIVDGMMTAFVKANPCMPLHDSPDYRFITALCRGIVSITEFLPGRNFILNCEEGQKMIWELLKVLPYIKYPKAESLKILMLEILNNISQDYNGCDFLGDCDNFPSAIGDCISNNHSAAIYKLALSILLPQTRSITSKYFLDNILASVDIKCLEELQDHKDIHIKALAKMVLRDINKAAGRKDTMVSQTRTKTTAITDDFCQCQSEGFNNIATSTKQIPDISTDEIPSSNRKVRVQASVPDDKRLYVQVLYPNDTDMVDNSESYVTTKSKSDKAKQFYADSPGTKPCRYLASRNISQTPISSSSNREDTDTSYAQSSSAPTCSCKSGGTMPSSATDQRKQSINFDDNRTDDVIRKNVENDLLVPSERSLPPDRNELMDQKLSKTFVAEKGGVRIISYTSPRICDSDGKHIIQRIVTKIRLSEEAKSKINLDS